MDTKQKISELRKWMQSQKVDAFLLPVADEYLSEYVPPHAQRLAWLTEFTGSAGAVIVMHGEAYLFTDGRYTLQAEKQLDASLFKVLNMGECSTSDWLLKHGDLVIAYDPKLHSAKEITGLKQRNIKLHEIQQNPIDAMWHDRPAASNAQAWVYPDDVAGEASPAKITRISKQIKDSGAEALFIAAAENINWLLNIRGGDLECTPILQCYALLNTKGEIVLFADKKKFPEALLKTFQHVDIKPLLEVATEIAAYRGKTLLMDMSATPHYFVHLALQNEVVLVDKHDPIHLAKAIKNKSELAAIRSVHKEDGAALATAFAWLAAELKAKKTVDEIQFDHVLNKNRASRKGFVSLSFPAIIGAGEHGAIIHYRVTPESNRTIKEGELLLVDSGGQYMGGTTDVTRTLAIGEPKPEYKEHYTRVLKGHIALAMAVFPEGTNGSQLDALARQYLWQAGLDYEHGTGHGVGACLGVHEGPQRISKRGGGEALRIGMVLSNEPGVYINGSHGIRIENLVEVVEKKVANKTMLGFENLTYVPYDRALIDVSLLTQDEMNWVNNYHAKVLEYISPLLVGDVKSWLNQACKPIS